jgi:hypothetical protein
VDEQKDSAIQLGPPQETVPPAAATENPAAPVDMQAQVDLKIAELEAEREAKFQAELAALKEPAGKPRREVELTVPDPYDDWRITIYANPSDAEVNIAGRQSLGRYLRHFIIRWNLTYQVGTPIPLTVEGLAVMPGEVSNWLVAEMDRLRRHPLATPSAGSSRELMPVQARPDGGSKSSSRNGST